MRALVLVAAAALCGSAAVQAQAPSACDRLAGVEQKRCLQLEDQRRRERERLGREDAETPRKCDALFGPEKELCLKRGGTVRAGAPAPSGAAGASAAREQR